MRYGNIVKRGFLDGLNTTWELAKVIIPVYFLITLLKYTPVLGWMTDLFAPIMSLVGLPGEAALPIVLANALTIYPAIPAIMAFTFTAKEITIISSMILISHALIMEGAVAQKTGVSMAKITVLRIVFAIIAGMILNFIL